MLDNLFSLKNKVVIITGAAGLLGKQHAEIVAQAGGIPVLLDINQQLMEQITQDMSKRYDVDITGWCIDITDEAQIQENCKKLQDRYGYIYGLVNNAANNPKVENEDTSNFSRLENFPLDKWNDDISVGLTGAFLCAKHYGSAISLNPEGGCIVNISSDLGLIAPDQRIYHKKHLPNNKQPVKPITYSVTKTALIGMTKYIATYWADHNVRCNAICPGGVDNHQDVEFIRDITSRIPLGRLANVDEYQGALLFLLSNASSYVNGTTLVADGGRSVW